MCMISWKEAISFPLSASGNIVYPMQETQLMAVKRCIPTWKSLVETGFSENRMETQVGQTTLQTP